MSKDEENTSAEAPKKSRRSLLSLSRKVLLASMGAAVLAQDEVSRFVDKMVEHGEIAEADARQLMREVLDKREKILRDKQAADTHQRPGAPATKADIAALNARIAELSKVIEELQKPSAK